MNQAVIEKVRKLRALAQSQNLNEAAAAAKAAERLIQEHNLVHSSFPSPGLRVPEPCQLRWRLATGSAGLDSMTDRPSDYSKTFVKN